MSSDTVLDIERNKCPYIDRDESQSSLPNWQAPWAMSWRFASQFLQFKSGPRTLKDITNRDGRLLSVYERAAQCIFLCVRSDEGTYAIQIPCIRRQIEKNDEDYRSQYGGEIYEPSLIRKDGFEDDSAIWTRIKHACFNEAGSWKQWLPFYGPTAVREVEFVGTINGARRFQIFDLIHVNEEEIKEKTDQIIASVPNEIDYEYDNGCMGYDHSTKCPASCDSDRECILDMANEALHLKRRLGMLFLLRNCARDPRKANGLNTLEGMARERCIYDLRAINLPRHQQPYTHADKMRGLEITMGWQAWLIESKLPRLITWTWFSLAIIWSVVIIWGGETKDWSGAMAFGQLLAACLAITALHANE